MRKTRRHNKRAGKALKSTKKSRGSYRSNKNKVRDNRPVDLHKIARMAMDKYGFIPDYPKIVINQVEKMDESIKENRGDKVVDLTHLLWSSIDNIDTEDLDQIEYCEEEEDGSIHVKVAIADVDAYVKKDSPADKHAQKNTTSVYTGIETFPMFPDHLSKNLTSLPMNEDRLAMITEYSVMPDGKVRPGRIYGALVRNKAKLVYEQIGDWLDGRGRMPKLLKRSKALQAQIKMQDEAARRLERFRRDEGALDLETMQTRAIVKDDKVLGLHIEEQDRAKKIIENFMIGANSVMSRMLEKSGRPTIKRVVRTPEQWEDIRKLAKEKRQRLPKRPDAKALADFLDKMKQAEPDTFSDLSLTVVKLLGPGEYVLFDQRKPLSHFCLAVASYTHSTAPNRRFPDLIIQRLSKALLESKKCPYGKNELKKLAERCTIMEHNAKKVERFMTKAEGAVLLKGRVGEKFEAIITGASDKGNYARLIEPPIEGKIMGKVKNPHVGKRIKVELINLDPWNGFIDFKMVN